MLKTGADALQNAGYDLQGYGIFSGFSESEIEDVYQRLETEGVAAEINISHPDILVDIYYNGKFNVEPWGVPERGNAPPPELSDKHYETITGALQNTGLPVGSR